MIKEEYRLIGRFIYHYNEEGKIVEELYLENEEFLEEAKEQIRIYDSLYIREILAASSDLTHRTNIYLEQLFKLFGESIKE